ncbi:MAG: hypothetical protein E3J78_00360 [Candidatus Cloacimonadota bacterium]|nr:MAG: hypothetical protein E3J78_00360 [Candidatus Cloacimonadota bacterium]
MYRRGICFFAVACFLFTLVPQLKGEEEGEQMYLLRLSSIGFPTAEGEKAAWGINDLKIFDGKLYIGHGDAVINTGPTDIISFDLKEKKFIREFTVDDEAIYRYQVVDGKLVIPGPDATEDWELGNLYILTDRGWKKKRTITHGIHVNHITTLNNRWYAATGSYFEFGENELLAFGGILASEDQGNTWKLVYASPTDDNSVFRIGSLLAFKDRLYVFPYAYRSMKKEDIPERYHPYLSNSYRDQHLIFTSDPLGPADIIVFDGTTWEYRDLITMPNLCIITPFLFNNRIVLSLITGTYVDYLALKDGLPDNAASILLVFDGDSIVPVSLEYELIRDVVVKKDRLLLLIQKQGNYLIAETKDLVAWKYYRILQDLRTPQSIEFDGVSFYIGTVGGNIFKSSAQTLVSDTDSVSIRYPLKIYGAAELPRDGKWYWAAITGWEKWGKRARFSCEIVKDNTINVETENVSSLRVFVPFTDMKKEKPVELKVANRTVFKEKLDGATELLLVKNEGMSWSVEKGEGTAELFQYQPKLIGNALANLTREGEDSGAGSFAADVLRWAVSADAAIIPKSAVRRNLNAGDVFLEDIIDLMYREVIYTFTVKGAVLYRMMNFNVKQDAKIRCQISGFMFSYSGGEKPKENNIIESSIDPAKDYLVATTEYVVRKMERFLGEDAHCKNMDILINDAFYRWFIELGTVGEPEPRIKRIK